MFMGVLVRTHLLLKDSQQKDEGSLGLIFSTLVENKLSELCG